MELKPEGGEAKSERRISRVRNKKGSRAKTMENKEKAPRELWLPLSGFWGVGGSREGREPGVKGYNKITNVSSRKKQGKGMKIYLRKNRKRRTAFHSVIRKN